MTRKYPAPVYYARWVRARARLVNVNRWWTAEIDPIDRRFWAWHDRQTFPAARPRPPQTEGA